MKNIYYFLSLLTLHLLLFASANGVFAQDEKTPDKTSMREKALAFVAQNRYADAFPLLEKVAPLYPNDAEIWAHYGIAILSRSVTLTAPGERKIERVKGYNVLMKAKQLGTKNVVALNLLDQLSPDGSDEDNFQGDPEFEKHLREGEGFFGRAEYDKAFAAYEKAYKINPKSYEAVLFMGDALYGGGKFKESETWFAKAVELEPNREQAYRFWGDALVNQNKSAEARDKFIDALIAEPYSRLTWDRIGRWIDESKQKVAPLEIMPPGNEASGEIKINEELLKTEDGTSNWRFYNESRRAQIIAAGAGTRTLAGEVAAYRKVAEAFRSSLKSGKLKYPNQSLSNLIKLDDEGLLEAYVLLVRPNGDIAEEYDVYRTKNRDKLRKFVVEFLLGLSK
jgi:tetratricopeptide (TPR) repeat protein